MLQDEKFNIFYYGPKISLNLVRNYLRNNGFKKFPDSAKINLIFRKNC